MMEQAVERTEIVEDAPIEQVFTEDFMRAFEKQAELYQNRYLPMCVRLSNAEDWINHGSREKPKFSLQASGAEKVSNPLGIVWERPVVHKHEREDEHGKYYEFEVEGIVQSRVLKRYGWFTGNCSSRDQFFNARGRFDEGDIRKAAFSNWLVNAVTRLAGIRNPSVDLLKKAGLNPQDIQVVDYSGRKKPEDDVQVVSEAQVKRLWAIARQNGVDDAMLHVCLWEKYQLKSASDIKRKDYEAICAWAQRGGKDAGTTQSHGPTGGSTQQPLPRN